MSDHLLRKGFDIPGLEFNFPELDFFPFTTKDGLKLFTYRYRSSSPRCLVVNFHGVHSYSANHAILGKYLSEIGCEFVSIDQRGHGRSEGIRGLIPSLETLISDNSKFLEELSLFYSNLPIYITGGSLGGALCFALSFKYPELVKGIIALNPAISGFIKCEKFLRCLLSCFSKCCPALKLSKRDPRTFCKNEEIIRYSSENTLNYSGKVRLGTASTIGNLMNYVRRRPHLVKCNVLIIVGLEDTIVNPKETEEFYLRLSVKYKDFWIYDDIEHAIVYSPKIYQICERIAGWMLEILKISKD